MTDLISTLRDTPNWMRESYGSWKDCVLKYDRAPFEAADEIERLTQALKKANDQAEHFEREWYLRGDEIERLRAALAKIADWDSNWGPFPENNEAWRAMVVVTAREAVPELEPNVRGNADPTAPRTPE